MFCCCSWMCVWLQASCPWGPAQEKKKKAAASLLAVNTAWKQKTYLTQTWSDILQSYKPQNIQLAFWRTQLCQSSGGLQIGACLYPVCFWHRQSCFWHGLDAGGADLLALSVVWTVCLALCLALCFFYALSCTLPCLVLLLCLVLHFALSRASFMPCFAPCDAPCQEHLWILFCVCLCICV